MQRRAGHGHGRMLGKQSRLGAPVRLRTEGPSPHRPACTPASAGQLKGWVQGTLVQGSDQRKWEKEEPPV